MSFGNSDRAVYSDLNPLDGGQSLYPMSTVLEALHFSYPLKSMLEVDGPTHGWHELSNNLSASHKDLTTMLFTL